MLKYLLLSGLSLTSTLICPNLLLFFGTLCLCLARGHCLRMPLTRRLCLALTGLLGQGCTNLLLSSSYIHIPVSTATTIHFLYPTVVTLASMALLRRRGTLASMAAIVLSIAGMICISSSEAVSGGHWTGYVLAGLSSLTYAFYLIGSERFAPPGTPIPVLMLHFAAGALLTALLWILSGHPATFPTTLPLWGLYIGSGMMISLGLGLLNMGISKVGAVSASFATLIEPVTAVICGVLVYGDPLTLLSVLGFALILASVWLNTAR